VRDVDLEAIAASLGLERDRHDPHKWRDADHIISINSDKFMDWLANKGGGGAIDLVMHVQQVDFQQAVQWLSRQDLSTHLEQSHPISEERQPLQMPVPNENRWAAVRNYLAETRKLPSALVDRLHQRGMIYADVSQNAVFVRHATHFDGTSWQRQEPTGASLRGTWGENNSFQGLAPGSSREQGWFWLGAGRGDIKRVLIAESPIDALSLATLDKHRQNTQGVTVYLSSDGSGAVPIDALRQVIEQGGQVAVGFDADQAGEEMAWRVAQQLPGVSRITPAYGKDWNERLVCDGQPERASQPQQDRETLKQLWQWHQVAQVLGKPASYVDRITEVARNFNRGVPLSEQARGAMQHDLQQLQQLDQSGEQGRTAPLPTRSGEASAARGRRSPQQIEPDIG